MNPELQRNLWLDATPRKLAFAGAILAGVFAAVWLLDRGRHAASITLAGAAVFALAALAWAPWAARRAAMGEALAGSWDFQRLTALSPWSLTWGKLAGSTARPWLVAGGGLLLAALQLASTTSFGHAAFWLLVAVALALTLQASGLATGLLDIRRARAAGRPLSARAPGLLLLVLALLTVAGLVWARARLGRLVEGALGGHASGHVGALAERAPLAVHWFGHAFAPLGFAVLTLLTLAVWALVWAWRLMRLELQYANAPWAWAGFLAWLGVYVLGFDPVAATPGARLAAVTGAWALMAYVAAFAGPADRVRARQFTAALRMRRLGRVVSHLPLTVLPSALALCAGGTAAALRARSGDGAGALAMLAALAFFGRDLGVIAWRRFAGRGRRGDAGVLLLLLALYTLGAGLGWLVWRGRGVALFWPSMLHPRLNLLAPTLEALVAWGLAALAVARPRAAPRPPPAPLAPAAIPAPTTTAVPPTEPQVGDGSSAPTNPRTGED